MKASKSLLTLSSSSSSKEVARKINPMNQKTSQLISLKTSKDHPISTGTMLSSPIQNYRSVFELTSSGKSNDFIDNIEYYMDAMLSKFTTTNSRRQYAFKLIQLINNHPEVIRLMKVNDNMQRILKGFGKILYELDHHSNVYILLMILTLCCRENGSFDDMITMPIECIIGLLQNIVAVPASSMPPLTSSQTCQPVNDQFSQGKVAYDDSKGTFSKKRKRQLNSSESSTAVSLSSRRINVDSQEEVDLNLLVLMQSFKYSILFNTVLSTASLNKEDNHTMDYPQLCQDIALVVLSRCLVSQTQNLSTLSNSDQQVVSSSSSLDRSLLCSTLIDYQEATRLEYDQNLIGLQFEGSSSMSTANIGNTFLDAVVNQTGSLLQQLTASYYQSKKEKKASANRNQQQPQQKQLWSLFQYLHLLEALSFRHRENQLTILSATVLSSNHHQQQSISMIVLLSQIAHVFGLEEIAKQKLMSEEEDVPRTNNRDNAMIVKDTAILTTASPSQNFLRNLYPELNIISVATAAAGDGEGKGHDIDDEDEEDDHYDALLAVTMDDIFLSCYRILVNLTHSCRQACDIILLAYASSSSIFANYWEILERCVDARRYRYRLHCSNSNSSSSAHDDSKKPKKKNWSPVLSPEESSSDVSDVYKLVFMITPANIHVSDAIVENLIRY
jgi:hypothetical protein